MTAWDPSADSPLRPFLDGASRRARFEVRHPRAADPESVPGLLAGAAEVDLTPPPGMPKAGYSSNAHDGAGFRTRLRARVIHLRAGTASLALVQCDLLGGSSVVQHLVAQAIAPHTDVPLEGLFMGATHTHAGPGQFLGTDFYNQFASNRGGFDPAYTQFLVSQIARGVREAVEARRPARLAFGSTEVWGLTRNRSLDPYVQNDDVLDKRTAPQRKFVAINPLLHLLRVDGLTPDGGYAPLAAAVVFSIHGTGVSQHAHEYNADVWAYLVDEFRHRVTQATGTRPIVGAMEGTHADVAPAIRPGQAGHLEAERVGRGVGAAGAALHARLEADLHDDVQLGSGLRELNLNADRRIDGIELPNRPAVGAALMAGAHENLTPVIHRIAPFRAGHPHRRPTGAQGEKVVFGSRWLQPVFMPTRAFPRLLPLQILRIDSSLVVGLPFELTVETGRRIEAAVSEAVAGHGLDRVVVSSVANEYSGYVTTPEEYRRQFYEGGHTLYGPKTQPFLTAHVARLAAQVAREGHVRDVGAVRRFSLRTRRFLPTDRRSGAARRITGEPRFEDPTGTSDGFWELEWVDEAPGALRWHEPLVRVERSDDGGVTWELATHHDRLVDDQGCDVEVRSRGDADGLHRYATRWWNPAFRAGRVHRFVLLANGPQPETASLPFD